MLPWVPATLLAGGVWFTGGWDGQHSLALRKSLAAAIPLEIAGLTGRELTLPESDRRVAGVSAYLLRSYAPVGAASQVPPVSLYVGFYERQSRGKTIHSPKNCLPGAGWEPLSWRTAVEMVWVLIRLVPSHTSRGDGSISGGLCESRAVNNY